MLVKFLFIALVLTGCANGGWTREDTYRHTVLTGLMAVDYAQTMKIAREPDKYWERNPLLGEHPNEAEVTAYFLSAYAIKTGVAMALKPEYRKWWQYTMIGASAGCVGWNMHIGLGVGF